jgi:hypothetical protein
MQDRPAAGDGFDFLKRLNIAGQILLTNILFCAETQYTVEAGKAALTRLL